MAHELEIINGEASMFSVDITPWHGIGKIIKDAPTIESVLQLAGLDWTVSMRDMFLQDRTTPVDLKAIVRDSDNSVLGYAKGQRYQPLQNQASLEFFRPFHESGLCTFETAGSLRGGQKVWVLARVNSGEMEIVNGDVVRKYLLFSNAHDGKTGIRVGFTPIRVVCANTLAMAHTSEESKFMRVFHSKNAVANLEAIRDTVNLANTAFEATAEQYRSLARKQVNKNDIKKFVDIVFYNNAQAETDREKLMREKMNNEIEYLFQYGKGNTQVGVQGTSWALYNAATEYLSYTASRTQEVRLDSLWFGQGSVINDKAFKAAIAL